VRVVHATNVSTPFEQRDINPPRSGTVCNDPWVTRPRTERRRKALLAAAKQAVRERYAEFDLGLDDIAIDVGCSTRQLQRVFAELADESFRQHLLRVRMDKARRLLSRRKGGLTVRATAPLVGYRKPSGLRQAFLRFYGMNPSEVQVPLDYDELWRRKEERNMKKLRERQDVRSSER